MKLRKTARFRSATSVITATLATLALASGTASAAFVYHDTATTTGGTFSASFPIGNLKNAGHTSAADTENASVGNESYATTNLPTGGFPVTITLDFGSAVSLDEFYLWNHSNNAGAGAPANGVGSFSLTFFDGAAGTGSQIGSVFNSIAAAAPSSGLYAAEVFDFGTTYTGVSSILFKLNTRQANSTSGFVAVREIGFNQVPEPSTALLGGFGLLALIRRRR